MARWIVFDQPTADALCASLPGVTPEVKEGDALRDAVAGAPAIAVLPAEGGDALYLEIRMAGTSAPSEALAAAPAYEPGGFLGLSDQAVYGEDK